ncbi:MAG: YbaN family protein [Defluviitaleaceae bacterium]|nr:YbaN family protein [Defluviitaleaceae bacterium]
MKKALLIAAGLVSLALGAVGVILPILPTTPFVLLSAACFSMSHEGLEKWLQKNRIFGPFIDNYRTKQGISILHKTVSIAFLWSGLTVSMILTGTAWVYILLIMVGIGVTTHLLMIKTKTR